MEGIVKVCKVRATRKGQRMKLTEEEVGKIGRDGRVWYEIAIDYSTDPPTPTCTCEAWRFNHTRPCKHILKAWETPDQDTDDVRWDKHE